MTVAGGVAGGERVVLSLLWLVVPVGQQSSNGEQRPKRKNGRRKAATRRKEHL